MESSDMSIAIGMSQLAGMGLGMPGKQGELCRLYIHTPLRVY